MALLPLSISPHSRVGAHIAEDWISLVVGGECERVSGNESTRTVLGIEVVIIDDVLPDPEEHELSLAAIAFWHSAQHVVVDVEFTASGFECFVRTTHSVHAANHEDELIRAAALGFESGLG
ncbi:hypothetical protein KJ848_00820 [Patescibacteria group bacterium]|nr:hypothetical protein [Patescibacteria group bacterium]